MEKITLISIVLAVVLVAGAVFVSADFLEDEPKVEVKQTVQECNPSTCPSGDCGGTCGVPTCGCER